MPSSCPIMFVSQLSVMSHPDYVRISLPGGRQVSEQVIGPYLEGTKVTLICEVGGGNPSPKIFWFMNGRLFPGLESLTIESDQAKVIKSELIVKVSRDTLGIMIECKTANEAMDDYISSRVEVDVTLQPVSTSIISD